MPDRRCSRCILQEIECTYEPINVRPARYSRHRTGYEVYALDATPEQKVRGPILATRLHPPASTVSTVTPERLTLARLRAHFFVCMSGGDATRGGIVEDSEEWLQSEMCSWWGWHPDSSASLLHDTSMWTCGHSPHRMVFPSFRGRRALSYIIT